MVVISGYGAYVPLYRLNCADVAAQHGTRANGEVAIPGRDENHITMACEAAEMALHRAAVPDLAGVFVASVSDYFAEHGIAAHVAYRFDQLGNVRTADFQGSARAATDALLTACDVVRSRDGPVLVAGVDILPVSRGGGDEATTGAAAGAVILSQEAAAAASVASIKGAGQAMTGFVERHRLHGESAYSGDTRFEQRQGHRPAIDDALRRLTDATGANLTDFDLAVSTAGAVGFTGTASFFLDTVRLLENAQADETAFAANYGAGGADVLALEINDGVERLTELSTVDELLDQKEYMTYADHLQWRERAEYEGVNRS